MRVQGKQPGQEVETYALLDNDYDVSLCDERSYDQRNLWEYLPNDAGEKKRCKDGIQG